MLQCFDGKICIFVTGLGVSLDSDKPHLVGIDEDVSSTGITLYHLLDGATNIGSEEKTNDIVLKSASGIEARHCVINLKEGIATLVPQSEDAMCMINAVTVNQPIRLYQGCVIVLGKTNMFRYVSLKVEIFLEQREVAFLSPSKICKIFDFSTVHL